ASITLTLAWEVIPASYRSASAASVSASLLRRPCSLRMRRILCVVGSVIRVPWEIRQLGNKRVIRPDGCSPHQQLAAPRADRGDFIPGAWGKAASAAPGQSPG